MAELRYGNPVGSYLAGRKFRMDEQAATQQANEEQRRTQVVEENEKKRTQLAESEDVRRSETHKLNQQVKEFELEMTKNEASRKKAIAETDKLAGQLLSVLEAPPEQREQLWQSIYPELHPDGQKQFADGKFDEQKATHLVRSSLAVLDRLKIISQQQATEAKSKADLALEDKKHKNEMELETVKGKGAKGTELKAADENALYSRAAELFGGFYDPMSGKISGLSNDTAQKALSIAERASQLMLEGKADSINRAAAMAARELGINIKAIGAQPQGQGQGQPSGNDPLGLR